MVLTSSKKGGAVWGYFTCTGKTFKRTGCTAANWCRSFVDACTN
ncbi:hypothetical protein NKJ20_33140 [Mesorhizobium sp. M0185]